MLINATRHSRIINIELLFPWEVPSGAVPRVSGARWPWIWAQHALHVRSEVVSWGRVIRVKSGTAVLSDHLQGQDRCLEIAVLARGLERRAILDGLGCVRRFRLLGDGFLLLLLVFKADKDSLVGLCGLLFALWGVGCSLSFDLQLLDNLLPILVR